MRDIKFRAWDKHLECYHLDIEFLPDGYWDCDGRPIFLCECEEGDYGDLEESFEDNFILQQYTGIKDRKGREIYEGDFLEVPWHFNPKYKLVGEVVFWEGAFELSKGKETEIPEIRPFDLYEFNETPSRRFFWDTGEVIGNIFENPETYNKIK